MKQTAVEWFFWKLYILKDVEYESIMQLYKQAKEMEKEQMRDAYNSDRPNLCAFTEGTAFKEYYNKTYKKKKS